jgi:hypothetical protein
MNYKTPMQNQNKGYGKESASQETSNLLTMNPLSKHMSTPMKMGGSKVKGSAMMMAMKGDKKGDQSKSRLDYESPAKMGAKKGDQSKSRLDYEGSPAKNLGMKYDIKEASNQSLSKKARKHYAENAQAASKSGYKG